MKISTALLAAAVTGFLAGGSALYAEDVKPAVTPKAEKSGCNAKDGCAAKKKDCTDCKDEKKDAKASCSSKDGCKAKDAKKDDKAGCNGKDGCKAKDEKKVEAK
jgi:hypothetical protein